MAKEGFEGPQSEFIQMRFDETGVASDLVLIVREQETIVTEDKPKEFKKSDRILAPYSTKPGFGWVSVVSPFTGYRRDDLERIQGLTPFQTPVQVTAWDGIHKSYKTLPEGTVFGAHVQPNRKKR